MTKERILAEVLLHIPAAQETDVNRHISTAITQINEIGLRRSIVVTASNETDPSANPVDRTETQTHNYYPSLRVLVLPASVLRIYGIIHKGTALNVASASDFISGSPSGKCYTLVDFCEVRLSFDVDDGDEFEIDGRIAIRNLAVLPDSFENWLLNHVLSGLYAMPRYGNPELFALYESRRIRSWNRIKNMRQRPLPGWTKQGSEGY